MATIERHVTKHLVALDAITPCREAARLMADKKIGSVAVREGGRIVGVVTERDLVTRVLAAGDNGAMPIGEAMRTDLPRVTQPLHDTASLVVCSGSSLRLPPIHKNLTLGPRKSVASLAKPASFCGSVAKYASPKPRCSMWMKNIFSAFGLDGMKLKLFMSMRPVYGPTATSILHLIIGSPLLHAAAKRARNRT